MAGTAAKTDPALWEKVKDRVTRGDKGGAPGQWSARKAQLATATYKKEGGGYRGPKAADNHLSQWTREEWGTRSGRKSAETGERYLPRRARASLSKAEYDQTTARKRKDSAAGRQFSPQPAPIARKTAAARKTGGTAMARGKAAAAGPADGVALRRAFRQAANMPPARLARWLQSEESRSVGQKRGATSVGRQSGAAILRLRRKRVAELTAADEALMRKVIGFVHRHLAQRPKGDVAATRWRFSLMNWGHDPLQR